MIEVRSPVPQFFDTDGKPLDGGQIFVGIAGSSAESLRRTIYWDQAGLLAAPQPVSTINGFPARLGTPTKFFTDASDYSITVKNKKGIIVFSSLHANSGVFEELESSDGASRIGFDGDTNMGNPALTDVEDALIALHQRDNTLEAQIALSKITPTAINLFANSAFLVNQRAYASGTPTATANQYTLDRIRVVTSGQSLVFGASTSFGNYIIAPANGAEQIIEGNRIAGGEYACFWAGAGTITVNGTPRGRNEVFTLTGGVNATIRMFGEIEAMQFTRPEMIRSAIQNQFDYDFHQDLALCRRYYEYGEYVEFSGNVTTGGAYYARATFSVRKRANPVMTLTNFGTPSGFGATSGSAALITASGFTEERVATGTGVGRFISAWIANAEL